MGTRGVGSLDDDELAATLDAWQRISRRLLAARVRADLYQRQVARRMRTSIGVISRLEIQLVPLDWQEDEFSDVVSSAPP
jgi:hypothetical protein